MTYDAELHARVWPLYNSEIPVTVNANGLIGQGEGCAAWVDAIYLYSSFVVVRTCLIARPERSAQDDHSSVSLVGGGFDDDRASEVLTTITVDDRAHSTADGTLHFAGAGTASGRSEASWWLPTIPTRRLEVTVRWPRGGLEGSVVFKAGDWRNTAKAVITV